MEVNTILINYIKKTYLNYKLNVILGEKAFMGNFENYIIQLLLKFPAVLIALTFRPFAESLCAYLMGDKSQKHSGRLSISPRAHLDAVGFILLFLVGFGWSKPVYINDREFKNRRLGLALYFMSGTIMNVLVAVIVIWIQKLLVFMGINFNELYVVLDYVVAVNLSLGAFCLLPIPPLAGYYFLLQILPLKMSMELRKLERYSLIIIMLLMFTNLASYVIKPIYTVLVMIVNLLT